MPDDRLFHKRLGHSAKVAKLTDFEYIVWHAYVLSSDDFGIMRFSAVTLQADHDRLAGKPQKAVQRALERVRDVGLLVTFDHQGRAYCAQPDWQNYQRVKFPRRTINPKPPTALLATFTPATQKLLTSHPGKSGRPTDDDFSNPSEVERKDSESPSPEIGKLARARAPETANGLRLAAGGSEGGPGETVPLSRGIGSGVMAGSLPRDHVRHAFCGRVCVPDFLHSEFLRQIGTAWGSDPDVALRGFYAKALDACEGIAIADDPLAFWRKEFKARVGSASPSKLTHALQRASEGW